MEIQLADKRFRIVVVVALLAALAIGAFALFAFEAWLDRVQQLEPVEARRQLLLAFVLISAAACVLLAFMGGYLWRLGSRVRAARRFPMQGARVIRNTAVLQGDAAARRGKLMQAFGVALLLGAAGLTVSSWMLYNSVQARLG